MKFRIILIGLSVLVGCTPVNLDSESEHRIVNEFWEIWHDREGINGLVHSTDQYSANVLSDRLDTDVRFRINEGEWQSVFSYTRQHEADENSVRYTDYQPGMPFSLEQVFTLNEEVLEWDIMLENRMNYNVEIGDLAIKIPWRTPFSAGESDQEELFQGTFTKHHFIAGDGSFLLFTKPSGDPPFMLLTVKPGTKLEYFTSGGSSSYEAYIHSGHSGNAQERGTWRQPHTYSALHPTGEKGDRLAFGFKLQWAQSYEELRQLLYENRLIDIRVVPGMTLPEDLEARFSLHTKAHIDSVVAEYPGRTEIKTLGEEQPDHHIYSVKFGRLGENLLTVHFDGDRKTYLEFFSTEPVETLLRKRSSFIVNNQQHRKPDKWYDGLFSIWDMKNSVLRGPDNTDGYEGWWGYVLASDDPALGIAPYLASINAIFPNDEQIEATEYYLENFVWGGLQRTDMEQPYPYGIHGVPNWKVARDTMQRAKIENRRLDKMKIWRTYDYPHLFMLYYHMHQIAERYPKKVSYLDADGYFERMWQTARAFFKYPYEIYPWYDIYKWGNYNELLIPDIIALLEEKGRQEDADWLRNEWEKKVKYFIYDDPWPYRSEYPYDRTAFESSYALAKYGATTMMESDDSLWFDKNLEKWYSHPEVNREDALDFMERQLHANLAARGWLEAKYFLLGSDFTASSDTHALSYMAQMGGWSILDYGLMFSDHPSDWLQLGYASYLSAFALLNTGRPETDYGYWFPGEENDGALGWAFMSAKHGSAWIQKNEDRGAWRYDGEQNLGMGVVTRTAATILADDPLFGWFVYGGKMEKLENGFDIWPRDGVRIRFWVVDEDSRIGLELDRDGWSTMHPIRVRQDGNRIDLVIENRTGDNHTTRFKLFRTGDKTEWQVLFDGTLLEPKPPINGQVAEHGTWFHYEMEITNPEHNLTLVRD